MSFHPIELGVVGIMQLGVLIASLLRARHAAAFFLGWTIPGAGHFLLGRRGKGVFFFLTLSATYAFGLWVCGFRTVGFDDNPFYYVGQYGSLLTMAFSHWFGAEKAFPLPDDPLRFSWFDAGLLYVCVAGLLNLVVTLNVFEIRIGEPASPPEPREEGAV